MHSIMMLSQYFNVSADYLLTGASAEHSDAHLKLGLTNEALAFWEHNIDMAKETGNFAELTASMSKAMSSLGFYSLFWQLNKLNKELTEIDNATAIVLKKHPKPKLTKDNLVEIMSYNGKLPEGFSEAKERRELLKIRYLKIVERFFDGMIVRGEEEDDLWHI